MEEAVKEMHRALEKRKGSLCAQIGSPRSTASACKQGCPPDMMSAFRLVPNMEHRAFRCASHGGHQHFKDDAEFDALLDPEQYGHKTAKDNKEKANALWGIMASVTSHIEGDGGRHKLCKKDLSMVQFYDLLSATCKEFSELKEWDDIALYVHCGRNKRHKECNMLCRRCGQSTGTLYPVHETDTERQRAALVLKDALEPLINRIRGRAYGDPSVVGNDLTPEEYSSRMEVQEGPKTKRARTSAA